MSKNAANNNQSSSHLHYKALINSSMSAIFFSLIDGTILETNLAATEMFGYTEDEFRKVGRKAIFDHSDPAFQNKLSERKKQGRIKAELTGIRKNGERFPVEVSSFVFIDTDGKEYTCTVMNDISDRKKRENEKELLINNTIEAFIILDESLRIVSFNDKCRKFYKNNFGKELEKGAFLIDYIVPERREKSRAIYERVLNGHFEESEYTILLPDQSERSFLVRYHPARNDLGEIIGVFITSIDVTAEVKLKNEQIRLTKQLQERNDFIELILEHLPIGIAVNRIDNGKATLLNKQFSRIYGWSEEDLLDVETFFQLVYPDEKYRTEIVGRILADIASRDVERMQWYGINITTESGETRVINAKNIPLYEQNLMISTVLDMTKESRQAEEIKKAKANQEALINGTKDLIWSVGNDFKLITANKAYREMIWQAVSKQIEEGDSVLIESFGEQLLAKWKSYYHRVLNGESFSVKEELYIPETNETLYSLISLHPMYNDEGKIFGAACYSKDITEETRKTIVLEETKNKLSRIMDSSMDVICAVKADGTFIQVSRASEVIWGYTPEELIGRKFTDIIYPEDLPKTENIIGLIMEGNNMTYVRNRYVHKNGTIVPMEWSARWDSETQVRYAVGRDITEKLKAEEDLIESERRYKELFDNNPLPMHIWDFETKYFLDCNEAAIQKYGYSKEEFLQLTIKDIRPAEDIPLIEAATKNEMIYGDIHRKIWRHKKKNGEIMMMDLKGHLINYKGRRASLVVNNDVTEKLQAEDKLRQSEAFLAEAQRLAKMGSWNFDFRLDKLTWSDELYHVFGTDKNTFHETHKSFVELVDESDREFVLATSKKTQETGDPFNIEYHITTPTGEKRVIEEFGYGEKDAEGNVIRLFGTAQDITERKLAEEKIKESNLRYSYVSKATSDAIWDWDLISQTLYWGEGFQNIFGYQLKDLTTDISSWTDHLHPEDKDRVVKSLYDFINHGGTNWQDEYRYRRSDQTFAYVADKGILIKDEFGKPIRMVGAMQDITKQKEEQQHQKLLESVITNANDAVLITEAEPFNAPGPRIIYVNEAFTRMTGYLPSEVIGKNPRILQGPKSNRKELDRLKQAMQNWEPCEVTTINYKKSGEEFWINFTVSPVADANGWYTHWIAIERDVTERKTEELQKEFLNEVSSLFNGSLDLKETLQKVLEKTADYIHFKAAEAWLVSTDNKKITQMATYADSDQSAIFFNESKQLKNISKDEGLAGAGWERGEILFLNNVGDIKQFIRRDAAVKAGLRSACGVPLLYNQQIIGGMMFWSNVSQLEEQKLTVFFQRLSMHISAEIKRKQVEQDLNRIFSFAPDAIGIIGFDGYFKKINPVLPQILEYSEEELLNTAFIHFIHPDDKADTIRELESVREGNPGIFFENRYRTKSGKYVWISWTATPMKEEELIFAVGKNVTEKKEMEAFLQRASRLAQIGAWESDLITGELSWSDITCEIHEVPAGYQPNLETAIQFYKPGESRALITHAVKEGITKGTAWDLELQIITAKGNEKWVRAIGETEWVDGKCIRIYGSFQDIQSIKQNEQVIAETLNEKISILESIGDGFYTVDKNWIITYWNSTAEIILSRPREEVLGKCLWDVYPDVVGTDIYKTYLEVVKENKTKHFEAYYEGLSSWYEISAYPSKNGLSVYFKDVTFSRSVAENIRNSEEKRRLIMNAALDAIVCINTEGDITFWNPQAEAIFGWNENEVMGKRLSEIIIPENYREMHDKGMKNYLETGEGPALNVLLELTALKRTGEEVSIELTVLPIKQGSEEFFCAFIRDITEKKKAEIAIRNSNERYNLASKATSDIIWDWNLTTNQMIRSEENIEKLLGYKKEVSQNSGFIWMNHVHPDDITRVQNKIEEVLNDPGIHFYEDEYRFKKANNEYAYLYEKGYIIRNEEGKATRIIGSAQDITKLKENEIQLKKRADELAVSNQELEHFAFVASHDLQEPLRMITSFLTKLEDKYDALLDEKGKKYIYFAVDGAKRMRQIILDLLEYSRVGRIDHSLEDIDIAVILKEIEILLQKKINEKNAEVIIDPMPVVHSYRSPIRQVFQNLISNALKYSKEGKPVKIHIGKTEYPDYWEFYVKDNGIGIHPDYFEKVFVLFQRLHTKSEYTGTGIGLSVSKKIVENLGGKIWVDSTESQGSTFYFTIPKKTGIL